MLRRRWGVATIDEGITVGVAGHHWLRRSATRRVNDLTRTAGAANPTSRKFRVVLRSFPPGPDWGPKPGSAASGGGNAPPD
jgi:hypothetical protein